MAHAIAQDGQKSGSTAFVYFRSCNSRHVASGLLNLNLLLVISMLQVLGEARHWNVMVLLAEHCCGNRLTNLSIV